MFKALMTDSSIFIDSVSTIGDLIDEGIFKVDENGLSILAADRAMVAVVDLKLPPTAFDEFKVDKEENIAVNMTNLVSVLKRVKPDDKLSLELKNNMLEIIMKNSSSRRFTVPLLDITQEEIPPVDQLKFGAKIRIKADVLNCSYCTINREDISILGQAIIAASAVGHIGDVKEAVDSIVNIDKVFYPDEKNHAVYEERIEEYKGMLRQY